MSIWKLSFSLMLTFLAANLLSSCATSGRTTLFGAGLGAGVGAGIGAIADPGPRGRNRIRNVFIGATAGSLVGAGTGLLLHENGEQRDKEGYEKGKKDVEKAQNAYSPGTPGQPLLLPPRVEARYVEDQVRGSVFVPGHFEYSIVENAHWSR